MLLIERLRQALGPDYEVERELAGGGMGIVFLARQRRLERPVAVKVLRPEHATAIAAERFLAEGRLLARLSHPNIVPVYDAGESGGLLYFVMEFIEGETLASRLERGPLTPEEVVRLAGDLLAALAAAHALNVVHRDVKPANIFLRKGRALLGDFGIAHWRAAGDPGYTTPGQLIGTPRYMSPEQQEGEPVTPFTDVYAAGLVLYEACTGSRWPAYQTPEQGEWHRIPPTLETPMRRALALAPGDRWPDGKAFGQAVVVRKRPLLRPVLIAGALLIAIAAAVLLVLPPGPAPHQGTSMTLAVSPFALLGDAGVPDLGNSIASAVRDGLLGYVDFYVPPVNSPRDSLAVQVTGAGEVTGRQIRLTLDASDPRKPGSKLAPISASGAIGNWRTLADSLALGLIRNLFNQEASDFLGPWLPRGAIPGRDEAFSLWLQGEQYFAHADWQHAEDAYRRSMESDSTCYLCSFRLLDINRWTDEVHDTLLPRLGREIDRFPPPYQDLIRAFQSSPGGRLKLLARAAENYPSFFLTSFEYGDELFHRGPLSGTSRSLATRYFENAVLWQPRFGPAWEHLAWLRLSEGDSASVDTALASLKELRATSVFSESVRVLLQLGRAWKFFSPGTARTFSLGVLSDPRIAGNPESAAGARLLMTTDAPVGAVEFGKLLTQVNWPSKTDAIQWGLLGQLFGFAALGRLDSMRRVGSDLSRMTTDRSLTLLAWELEAVLRQFDPEPALRSNQDLTRALDGYASAGAPDDPLRHRATWMMGLLAARTGDSTRASAARALLAMKPESIRMLQILDATLLGSRDPARGLQVLPEMPPIDVRQGPTEDPLEDTVVRLLRAEWQDRSGDRPGALKTLLWQEHLQTIGHLNTDPQPGEMAWAVSTLARWRRAHLLGAADGAAAQCAAYKSVARRWTGSQPPFALRADSAAAFVKLNCP